MAVFGQLVEQVKSLPFEEKEALKSLLERYLIEERREDIYQNYQESLKEVEKGNLKFSSNINELREMIE